MKVGVCPCCGKIEAYLDKNELEKFRDAISKDSIVSEDR